MNNDMNPDDDTSRHDAPEHDSIRDAEAVTWQDNTTYAMPLPQVYARFLEAGLDRSLRTLQRYCEQGHLRAAKYPTETGAVWYVDPDSVETKIEEIRQVQETLHRPAPLRHDTPPPTATDTSRPDADGRSMWSAENQTDSPDMASAKGDDNSRQQNHDAARRALDFNTNEPNSRDRQPTSDGDDKYVTVPVVMLDALTTQLAAKDEQIKRLDQQMERLIDAHDKDRQLLGAALAIIHKEDFPMELGEGETAESNEEPAPAEEIRPEFAHDRGHPQPPQHGGGL